MWRVLWCGCCKPGRCCSRLCLPGCIPPASHAYPSLLRCLSLPQEAAALAAEAAELAAPARAPTRKRGKRRAAAAGEVEQALAGVDAALQLMAQDDKLTPLHV